MADSLSTAVAAAHAAGVAVCANGTVATYIPELGRANPAWVGIAVHTLDGQSVSAGDADVPFTLQSVSKVFALSALLANGDEALFEHVSLEPSGDAFHSIVRLEEEAGRPRNPLINAGAIVVSDRLPGATPTSRIEALQAFLRKAAGVEGGFEVDTAVYASEDATGFRNRALASYMTHHGVLKDPESALDTYFRQCSMSCTAEQLARAGLFLANRGRKPDSNEQLVPAPENRLVVSLMTTCGLYDEVGTFAAHIGIPAKSGVSGALLAVVPGRLSIACYGPALGPKGNSRAGVAMLQALSAELGLSVFEA